MRYAMDFLCRGAKAGQGIDRTVLVEAQIHPSPLLKLGGRNLAQSGISAKSSERF